MRNLVYLSAFVSGGAIMVLEITATRIIEPFLGNSIFTWIGVLSVVLASLSIGYFLGGKAADKNPQEAYLGSILLFSGFSIALIPLFSFHVLQWCSSFGMMYGPILASAVLLSIPSITLAMVSPYLVKLSTKKLGLIGTVSGTIYAVSTAGSIFGTLLTGFYLFPYVGVKATLFSLSMVLIANGILFLGKRWVALAIIGLIINLVVPQPVNFQPSSRALLLYETYSPYQYLRVVDRPEEQLRVLSLGHGSHTVIYLNSTDMVPAYQKYQKLIYLLRPTIRNALFIGLGGGAMPNHMHKETEAYITVVEIDPEVVWIAKKFFNFSEDERMRVWLGDGRLFLANSNERYDYIVMDAYLNPIPPFHLATVEFVGLVKEHLNPEGIVFVNVISPVEGDAAGLFRSIFKIYKKEFKNVYVFPSNNLNLTKRQNIVLLATDLDYGGKEDFISLIHNLTNDTEIQELATYYYGEVINTDSDPLLTDDFSPLEILALGALSAK